MWYKLPREVIDRIISFSYSPQPKVLLEDITSFCVFLAKARLYYYEHWIRLRNASDMEDRNWLANDISHFCNEYKPTLFNGIMESYVTRLRGLYVLRRRPTYEIFRFLNMLLYDGSVDKTIFVLTGIMTPTERTQFLKKHCI